MVADVPGSLAVGGGQEPLDVRPARAHRQALLFENPWPLDAGGKALCAPALRFGVSEKAAQGLRGGGQRNAPPPLGGFEAQKRVDLWNSEFG
jgi:hypothetical protein